MNYILIDTGTTNTRIRYVEDGEILSSLKYNVGVKDTAITGNLNKLKDCIRKGIEESLKICNRKIEDIDKIIASGMITSELGLIELNHILTPVSIQNLSKAVAIEYFSEIVKKPIYFIPGVKNSLYDDAEDVFIYIDMMRGEEVESIGIIDLIDINEDTIYISPGSHTKFIFINKNREISRCSTTLTGELLWALSSSTILAESLPKELITSIDKEYLEKGLTYADKYGFSKSCFLVRIMDLFTDATKNQLANFIAGAIGYYDIKSVEDYIREKKYRIVIGGSKHLRELYGYIFKLIGYSGDKIYVLDDSAVKMASVVGAIRIVEECSSLKA